MKGTGAVLTDIGVVATVAGGIMYGNGLSAMIYDDYGNIEGNTDKALTVAGVMLVGIGLTCVGVPFWIIGGVKKNNIDIALVKFKGSASINGVGL